MSTPEYPVIITGKSLMLNWDPNMDSPLDLVISLGHRSPGFTVRLLVIDIFLSFSLSEDPVINSFFFLTFIIISYCIIINLREGQKFKDFYFNWVKIVISVMLSFIEQCAAQVITKVIQVSSLDLIYILMRSNTIISSTDSCV